MPVHRVEKQKNFTIIDNGYLRDQRLSLKAKGLLTIILSLPEGWDYSAYGLATLCKECKDTVRAILEELERFGYLKRSPLRDGNRFAGVRYDIYERPPGAEEKNEQKKSSARKAEKITQLKTSAPARTAANASTAEDQPQLNTLPSRKEKSKTDASSRDSFLPSVPAANSMSQRTEGERRTERNAARERVRDQIEYALTVTPGNRGQLDELVELITEVNLNRGKNIRLGKDEVYPAEYVRERFGMLTSEHLQKVLDGLQENSTRVYNTRAYLLSALFNATATLDNHYTMQVNYDMRRWRKGA